MKNTNTKTIHRIAGIISMVMLLVMWLVLAGCAYEVKMIKDVPVEQQASLYLVDRDQKQPKIRDYFDTLDGNKTNLLGIGLISYQPKSAQTKKPLLRVVAGEHTIGLSTPRELLPGRKKYEATYNFEAGKRYSIQIGVDPSLSLGDQAKNLLLGEYIVIITDMDKR